MHKMLITGNNFIQPEMIENSLRREIRDRYPLEIEVLRFADIPNKCFCLYDNTVVSSGMSVEDPNIKKPAWLGISEYYGHPLALLDKIQDVDFLVMYGNALPREVIDRAEKLKWVLVMRGGPVNVDREYLAQKGIPLYNTAGRNATGVAELTIGLLLCLKRHILESNESLRSNIWNLQFNTYETAGTEIYGKRVGLVGFGKIARHLAGILKAFEAEIVAYDPFAGTEVFEEYGVTQMSLEELLQTCDIVSLHARLGKNDPPLIGQRELEMMKPGAILINTARGRLLDYRAALECLKSGRLGGAAFDVYGSEEFRVYKELLSLPNVIGTSHLGGVSQEAAQRGAAMTTRQISELLEQFFVRT